MAIGFDAKTWQRIFLPVSGKQTALLALGALAFGAIFVNYIEYGVFAILTAADIAAVGNYDLPVLGTPVNEARPAAEAMPYIATIQ